MNKLNFDNLLAVLNNERPGRPTLFELFMNESVYERATGIRLEGNDFFESSVRRITAFERLGYDYTSFCCGRSFPKDEIPHMESVSLNDGAVIHDRESFENYPWPDVDEGDFSIIEKLSTRIPDGMKLICYGPGGVLENAISLLGYDNLCFMSIETPDLLSDVCGAIGCRLVRYYEIIGRYECVGAMISAATNT